MSTDASSAPPGGRSGSNSTRQVVDGDVTIDCYIPSYRSPDYPSLWHIKDEKIP